MKMTLQDHIDVPIQKSVVGLSLLGFETYFSCCGFTYNDEKVIKSHIRNKPYIYICHEDIKSEKILLLHHIAAEARWTIAFAHSQVPIIDFHGYGWEDNHPWSVPGSPHKPEMPVLSINSLEKAIEKYRAGFLSEAIIEDGNAVWSKRLKYWQYPVSEPWKVNPAVYDSL